MNARASSPFLASPIPASVGIGLRAPHYRELLETLPSIGWFEVHSENYFGDGGQPLHYLERFRSHYPMSLHGVGLSLGSVDPLNQVHLKKLKSLVDRFEPGLVSDHLCWGSVGGQYLNDLLPLPYTEEALAHVATRVCEAQDYLGRQMLVENVSSYLQYKHSTIPEWGFSCGSRKALRLRYLARREQHLRQCPESSFRRTDLHRRDSARSRAGNPPRGF